MNLVTPGLGLIFWQLLTFLVVVFVLSKVAWKPILQALHERDEEISNSLAAAKQAKEDLTGLAKANEKLIVEARTEREKMIKEAQQTASSIVAEAQVKAKAETSKITEDAKTEIEGMKNAAFSDLRKFVGELSLEIAEKVLRENLSTQEAQKSLVAKYINESSFGKN